MEFVDVSVTSADFLLVGEKVMVSEVDKRNRFS